MVKDEIIGVGEVFLRDLKPNTTVTLLNRDEQNKGTITFNLTSNKAIAKLFKVNKIKGEYT